MTDDKRIFLEAMIAEREGMVAENTQRTHLGQSVAYGAGSFNDLAERIGSLTQTKVAPREKERLAPIHEALLFSIKYSAPTATHTCRHCGKEWRKDAAPMHLAGCPVYAAFRLLADMEKWGFRGENDR